MKKIAIFITLLLTLAISFTSFVGCANAKSTDYDLIKQTKMDNFTLLNQTAKHGQIVFIGDSIIELYPTYELFSIDRVVYNRGISGDTSDKMCYRLLDNVINIEPSIVSILIGTNDKAYNFDINTTLANIKKSVELIKENSPNTKIILQSIYPVNKAINSSMVGSRTNNEIIKYNEAIKTYAETNSVTYADVFAVLKDEKGEFNKQYTYDGLHPNAKGYIAITEYLITLF